MYYDEKKIPEEIDDFYISFEKGLPEIAKLPSKVKYLRLFYITSEFLAKHKIPDVDTLYLHGDFMIDIWPQMPYSLKRLYIVTTTECNIGSLEFPLGLEELYLYEISNEGGISHISNYNYMWKLHNIACQNLFFTECFPCDYAIMSELNRNKEIRTTIKKIYKTICIRRIQNAMCLYFSYKNDIL